MGNALRGDHTVVGCRRRLEQKSRMLDQCGHFNEWSKTMSLCAILEFPVLVGAFLGRGC